MSHFQIFDHFSRSDRRDGQRQIKCKYVFVVVERFCQNFSNGYSILGGISTWDRLQMNHFILASLVNGKLRQTLIKYLK